ncbi:MAG: hypothetical protein ACK5TG_18850 [Planctomyces sp.]
MASFQLAVGNLFSAVFAGVFAGGCRCLSITGKARPGVVGVAGRVGFS